MNDKKFRNASLKNVLLIITYTVLLIFSLIHIDQLMQSLRFFYSLISPFISAIAVAYVFNIPMKFYLSKISLDSKYRRGKAAGLSLLTIFLILFVIIVIVAPQIVDSTSLLISNIPTYIDQTTNYFNNLVNNLNLSEQMKQDIFDQVLLMVQQLLEIGKKWIPSLLELGKGITSGLFNGIVNALMACVIAIYLTISKEHLLKQFKRVLYAFLPDKVYDYICETGKLANVTFSNFITGQLSEAVIIGILCYIGCLILRVPYAPILAVIIGCTNIIPIFGPIIGTFIAGFLVLFVSPVKAIIFVIFGILLQQVESNLIYPRVVGNSVGLSGLWTLFAISVGGGMFGVIGMLLGLPVFALCYRLFADLVNKRVHAKNLKKTME